MVTCISISIKLLTGHAAFTGEYTAARSPSLPPVHLTHTHTTVTTSAENPLQTTQHIIAACPLHIEARRVGVGGTILPGQSRIEHFLNLNHLRHKGRRRGHRETSWQHLRHASDHGGERLHRRLRRMRITDKCRSRRAQTPHYTNVSPSHNTKIKLHHHSYQPRRCVARTHFCNYIHAACSKCGFKRKRKREGRVYKLTRMSSSQ